MLLSLLKHTHHNKLNKFTSLPFASCVNWSTCSSLNVKRQYFVLSSPRVSFVMASVAFNISFCPSIFSYHFFFFLLSTHSKRKENKHTVSCVPPLTFSLSLSLSLFLGNLCRKSLILNFVNDFHCAASGPLDSPPPEQSVHLKVCWQLELQ